MSRYAWLNAPCLLSFVGFAIKQRVRERKGRVTSRPLYKTNSKHASCALGEKSNASGSHYAAVSR